MKATGSYYLIRKGMVFMNNKRIYKEQESGRKMDAKKVEAQVQRAFLNMLYEQGILTDKVCTIAMSRIAEGV